MKKFRLFLPHTAYFISFILHIWRPYGMAENDPIFIMSLAFWLLEIQFEEKNETF